MHRSARAGAYMRSEGLFSSQITEWRELRDAGVLAGKQVGKPSAEQAEIARLRRGVGPGRAAVGVHETALVIMGKAHALLEQISESADTDEPSRKR